jgi:hypothetical protein
MTMQGLLSRAHPTAASEAWAALLARVPDRHRGAAYWRAYDVALWWCASGLADHAAALGWDEVELFGVRARHPFRGAPLRGVALTGAPRLLTDQAAYFRDGGVVRRGQFGPDFIPLWCLDRRLRRPERHLVQLPSGLWAPATEWRAA